MQVIIVEDRPWCMMKMITLLENSGIIVKGVVFVKNDNADDEEVKEKLNSMQENGIRIISTDHYGFEDTMNEFYKDEENLFLCDLNLTWNRLVFFEERENVRYAMKLQKEGKLQRIWFYTTSGERATAQIEEYFPQRNITVERVDENNQIILDIEKVKNIINQSC